MKATALAGAVGKAVPMIRLAMTLYDLYGLWQRLHTSPAGPASGWTLKCGAGGSTIWRGEQPCNQVGNTLVIDPNRTPPNDSTTAVTYFDVTGPNQFNPANNNAVVRAVYTRPQTGPLTGQYALSGAGKNTWAPVNDPRQMPEWAPFAPFDPFVVPPMLPKADPVPLPQWAQPTMPNPYRAPSERTERGDRPNPWFDPRPVVEPGPWRWTRPNERPGEEEETWPGENPDQRPNPQPVPQEWPYPENLPGWIANPRPQPVPVTPGAPGTPQPPPAFNEWPRGAIGPTLVIGEGPAIGQHYQSPPRRNEKERKGRLNNRLRGMVLKGISNTTEIWEMLECAYKSLPRDIRWKAQQQHWAAQREYAKNNGIALTNAPWVRPDAYQARRSAAEEIRQLTRGQLKSVKRAPARRKVRTERGWRVAPLTKDQRMLREVVAQSWRDYRWKRQEIRTDVRRSNEKISRVSRESQAPQIPLDVPFLPGGGPLAGQEVSIPGTQQRAMRGTPIPGGNHMTNLSGDQKLALLYQHERAIDMNKFLACVAADQIEDFLFGRVGQALGDIGRRQGGLVGFGTGPTF